MSPVDLGHLNRPDDWEYTVLPMKRGVERGIASYKDGKLRLAPGLNIWLGWDNVFYSLDKLSTQMTADEILEAGWEID